MLRFIIWLMGLLVFGPKRKNGKPGMTLPMVIAKAHNLSVQFAGLQMAAAYLAAVTISCISVVIGMCHQIVVSQPTWKPALAYPIGFVVGALAAFIFDGLTIASLKRMKTVSFGWNTITFFNLFFVAGGITFSTLAGDQMWALIFPSGNLSGVFAVGVSAVLIATEMWPKQHEQAVKKSVARGDVLTFALSEESDEHIENLSRDNRVNLLSSPQFQADLNADTSDIVKQILIDKYKQQITPIMPKTEIVESDLQQLPSPQSEQKLLPAPVQPAKDFYREDHPDVTSLVSLPFILDLTQESVKQEVSESTESVKFSSSNEPDEVQDGPIENLTHTTDPLPVISLTVDQQEIVKVRKPRTVKATPQNPTSVNAKKIKIAQAKLVKQGVKNPSKAAIAREVGISRQAVSDHFKKMAIAEEA